MTATGTLLATLWPTAAVALAGVVVVLALCLRSPSYAFALALLLYSFEGTIKMRLTVEGAPSPLALGAGMVDLAFLAALLALLLHDRGWSLRRCWDEAAGLERAAAVCLLAWLALSVLQLPLSGDLAGALEGFRLTQGYVLAGLGGIIVASRRGEERLAPLLLAVVVLALAYAALQGILGPSFAEQTFARGRAFNTEFGDFARTTGSFTSPVALVSFLAPAGVLCLVFGFLRSEWRVIAWTLFALAMVGIVTSYVRTALVAVVAGAALLALLLALGAGTERRRRVQAIGLVALALAGGYGATLLVSDVDPQATDRARSLANPFTDDSIQARLDTWGESLERVAGEPLGTGIGTVGRATIEGKSRQADYTDNSYLKVVQEQGVVGGLLFLTGLGGILIALARRLIRIGPARRPLGTAAFTGFGAFLVLLLMGEFIEQPGKLLAWTLLGVVGWETFGRPSADEPAPPRRLDRPRLGALAGRPMRTLSGLSRGALLAIAAMAVVLVVTPVVLALTRDDYRSSSTVVLSLAAIPELNPDSGQAVGARFLRALLQPGGVPTKVAERAGFLSPSETAARYERGAFARGPDVGFTVTARGRTPAEARRLGRGARDTLTVLSSLHALLRGELERQDLRARLRSRDLTPMQRAAARTRLRTLARRPPNPTKPTPPTRPAEPQSGLDRFSEALAGDPTPAPNPLWAGAAGLIFALAGLLALALVARPAAASRGDRTPDPAPSP